MIYNNSKKIKEIRHFDTKIKKVMYNDICVYNSEYDNYISGTLPLTFEKSVGKPLVAWEIKGNTFQEWTPSPEPLMSANLLNPYEIERGGGIASVSATDSLITLTSMTVGAVANSGIIKCNNTTYSYSFSGDIDGVTIKVMCYDTNDMFLGQCNTLFEEEGRGVVTTLENTNYVRIVFTTTKSGYINLSNLIFAEGGAIIPFVPYGAIPKTGQCEIKGVGDKTRNLFDSSDYISDNVIKFVCHMTEGVRYTISNESNNTVRIKVGRHRDDYSSLDVIIEPQGKSTFTMTRNPNVPASATLYIMIKVDDVWVTEPSQIEDIFIMLCEGAGRMPYEEYGYKIPIRCNTGKNLWDEKSKAGYYSSSDVWSYANNQICTENYIKVKPNTQYWLGVPYERQRGSLGILLYDENKEFLRRENSEFYLGSGIAYTTQADTYFIKLNFGAYYKTAYENDIIIVESDTEIPYEPYHEPIITPIYIASPLMSGEILKSSNKREVKWGIAELKGTEYWVASNGKYFTSLIDGKFISYSKLYSSHFRNDSTDGFTLGAETESTALRLSNNNRWTTVDELKAWLKSEYDAGHPVIIYYQLKESIIETVTTPKIPTFKGINTIDIDTEVKPSNIKIQYKANS